MKYGLAVDIGNTNTVFGLYSESDGEILKSWRTVTHRDRTSDELGIFLKGFLQSGGIVVEDVAHFIYSSVVPSFNPIVEKMVRDYYHTEPLRVHYELPLPIRFVYPRPYEKGRGKSRHHRVNEKDRSLVGDNYQSSEKTRSRSAQR